MGGDPALQQHFGDAAPEDAEAAAPENTALSGDAETWRQEVAARLERYRARRKPRAPRYPSLFLPFEPLESRTRSLAASDPPVPISAVQRQASTALQIMEEPPAAAAGVDFPLVIPESPDPAAKVIEFPRSAAIPVFRAPELAEPVLDCPRIVEAPEILPPPPALGGILIEAAATKESERKNSSEVPLSPATIAQRLAAALIDGLILGAALAAFAEIFLRLNPERNPLPLLAASSLAVALLLWCAYEFLFVVYTGSTPGLRALKLRLVRFDGSPVYRRSRRWRVLASFLSALSLGLGYLWSVLDEDGLCWHDRITRTHIQAPDPTQ